MTRLHPSLFAVAIAAIGMAFLCGCGKDGASATASAATLPAGVATGKAEGTQMSDPNEIKAEPALMQRIKIGEPKPAEVGATLTVAARIEVDDTRVTRVGSPVMGRVTTLMVREGDDVKKGQVLAQLNSTGLSGVQLELLKANSQKLLARRSMDRAKQLLDAGVIGAAEVQRREAELAQASAEFDAARQQLLVLGMPNEAIVELEKTRALNPVSPVIASMDGTVMTRKVTIGQVVQPADTVVEIADLSHVWLVADVPEQNAGLLTDGLAVEAEVAALPGQKLHGKLSFVSSTVNPETRTVRARMDVANPNRRLKPAMLATMDIRNHRIRQTVVPATAVVREGDQESIFVQLAPDVFVLRPVKVGEDHGSSHRVLLEGIRPGEKIVIDGAFHLNNERRRRAISGSGGSAAQE
jgi:cobalt-zinc-cadmium efflux system membrane fusion protein